MSQRPFRFHTHLLVGLLAWHVVAMSLLVAAETNINPIQPEQVSFPNGELTLHGFIYKPTGTGPFPAVIYNHGSNKFPGNCGPLGQFWTSNGFVFFFPHRSGHGRSPGEWIVDAQQKLRTELKDRATAQQHDIELHERANLDVVAALAWLKQQSFVDTNKIVVAGISYGGIQTVLAAEKDLGVKAYVPFAPAAMSWQKNPLLRERLLRAVKNAKAPMFLLQATNDYDLGPSELLGSELKRKGLPNRAKLYPPFGDPDKHQDGHGGFAVRGSDIWGADVLAFVNESLKSPNQLSNPKTKTKEP
jgi:dipeptidyl aminopeptidase/acylaminoacyl peptidase